MSSRSTGRHIALLFEKPSLRTRSTFTIAVRELGGDVIEPPADVALGGRETIEDVARNLERWVCGAVVRTFAQARLEAFADAAPGLRVVNALTDEEHPCQALADCLTLSSAGERCAAARSRSSATATTSPPRWRRRPSMLGAHVRRRVAGGLRAAGRTSARRGRARRAASAAASTMTNDPVGGGRAAPTRSTRTSGRRWAGSRGRHAHDGLRALPGQRRADGARGAGTRSSCTACRPIAATR